MVRAQLFCLNNIKPDGYQFLQFRDLELPEVHDAEYISKKPNNPQQHLFFHAWSSGNKPSPWFQYFINLLNYLFCIF